MWSPVDPASFERHGGIQRYHAYIVRTQIQLTPEQAARLKRRAAERGMSMAALIREAVDALGEAAPLEERRRRALSAIGRFSSQPNEAGEEHDAELEQAYAQ